ncbi:hypothetical protein V6N13_034164 [Hibiscus sabdariffa]|uniref:Cullin family profile domain-containing protein n=1 Tax=Hibiscus sabdariffa TaxID=183260 RepID=A0ABR2F8G9_9ROSI
MRTFLDPKFVVLIAATISKKNGGTQGLKRVGEEDVEIIIDKARFLSPYLQGKDVFEKYYKQHLAKYFLAESPHQQSKRITQAYEEKATDDTYLDDGDLNVQHHFEVRSKVTNNSDNIPMSNTNGSVLLVTFNGCGTLEIFYSNDAEPESDFLSSDEWTGRKDIRHKGKKNS